MFTCILSLCVYGGGGGGSSCGCGGDGGGSGSGGPLVATLSPKKYGRWGQRTEGNCYCCLLPPLDFIVRRRGGDGGRGGGGEEEEVVVVVVVVLDQFAFIFFIYTCAELLADLLSLKC